MATKQKTPKTKAVDFQALFEAAPGLYLVLLPDAPKFTIVAVDDAYAHATNTLRENIIGKGLFEVFPDNPDDPQADGTSNLRASLERAIDTKLPDTMAVQKYDIKLPDSDAFEVRYWSPLNTPVLDDGRKVVYIIHRVEDVTEFVLAKEHGKRQTKIAKELRTRTGEMELEIFQRAQEIQVANKKLEAANKKLNQMAQARREAYEIETAALRQLNVAKDEFISIVSHQLRTPATGVKQFLGILREGFAGELTDTQMMALQHAYDSNERQLRVIDDMLKVARLDAGKIDLKKSPTDLSQLVSEVIEELHDKFSAKSQHVVFERPAENQQIEADPRLIRMVIENLVDNACKYTPGGKQIAVRLQFTDNEARVAVEDEGIGIRSEDMPRLFKKFSRIISDEQARSIDGSGIGLYWVDRVVDIHGGAIEVDSEPGRGSKFIVKLPVG